MKKYVLFFILFLFTIPLAAENESFVEITESGVEVHRCPATKVTYKGGLSNMMKFIRENISIRTGMPYFDKNFRALIQILVNENGQVLDVKIVNTTEKRLAPALTHVIKQLPEFIPANDGEKNVAAYYFLKLTY